MSGQLPDFVLIGGMKCGTSTLHDQLARQPGFFMSTPKEPCFFSDDPVWRRGLGWYRTLFDAAPPGSIIGESSTHYTKLPTYPDTVRRLKETIPDARLIYVVRDPAERIVSQYIHEWSMRKTAAPLSEALRSMPHLIDYSRYAMQIRPYIDAFGPRRILVVFFERMLAEPQEQLDRVGRFLQAPRSLHWGEDAEAQNVSAERLRLGPAARAVLFSGPVAALRRAVVPKALRERAKARLRMTERPSLGETDHAYIREQLAGDVAAFGAMLSLPLDCDGFKAAARATPEPALTDPRVAPATSAAPRPAEAGAAA